MIAIVDSEAAQPVVWGIGDSETEARIDASRWYSGPQETLDAMAAHAISGGEADRIAAGDASWPPWSRRAGRWAR